MSESAHPLVRSVRRRSQAEPSSANEVTMISWLDTAATTGFSSYRIPSNISLGSVGFEPDTNMAITISSNDVRNAKIAPLAMPGQRSGSIRSEEHTSELQSPDH